MDFSFLRKKQTIHSRVVNNMALKILNIATKNKWANKKFGKKEFLMEHLSMILGALVLFLCKKNIAHVLSSVSNILESSLNTLYIHLIEFSKAICIQALFFYGSFPGIPESPRNESMLANYKYLYTLASLYSFRLIIAVLPLNIPATLNISFMLQQHIKVFEFVE